MKYETLKAGDVRRKGDEVRSKEPAMSDWRHNPEKDPSMDITKWRKTELVGEEILKIDLSHLELRRPVKE